MLARMRINNTATSTDIKFRILATILLILLVGIGGYAAFVKAPFAFGFGDNGLFHAFGHWIRNGEVFMRDFIHFRTPGPYYYYAFVQSILGDTFLATSTAILAEAYVFQIAASFFLALAASKALWSRPSLMLAFCTGLIFLFVPPIFQLRTAVPTLALALYLFSLTEKAHVKQHRFLFLTGFTLGISYWFGQEIFVFLALSIAAAEFSAFMGSTASRAYRIFLLASGVAVTIVPGLVALAAAGVDLGQYLYNTIYYAFVIQPHGMDTSFPHLNSTTIVFYVWFWVLIGSIAILAYCDRLFHPAAVALTSYTCLRMISALGRADILHLWFSISEVFIIFPVSIGLLLWPRFRVKQISNAAATAFIMVWPKLNARKTAHAATAALIAAILFRIGMKGHASILLAIPLLLVFFSYRTQRLGEFTKTDELFTQPLPINGGKAVISSLIGCAAAFAFTYPHSMGQLKSITEAGSSPIRQPVLGVQLPPEGAIEMGVVRKFIADRGAKNIFSYPIRPEFYAFVPHHGTRFVEFEPQTTKEDISSAISDLVKSRPTIVIRDLDQVADLSPVVHELSDFIMSNYQSTEIAYGMHKLELMELRGSSIPMRRLFDHSYEFNTARKDVFSGMRQVATNSTVLVIEIIQNEGIFKFSPGSENVFRARIYPEPGASRIGKVELTRGKHSLVKRVSISDGLVDIPIPAGNDPIEIRLRSADKSKMVLWEDPIILNIAHAQP